MTFFLDTLFFPAYKKQAVDSPLFILGNFRSGSTFLQRLVAQDKEQFASARTWDIFLSPSVTLTKISRVAIKLDRLIGNPLITAFKKFDSRTLGQVAIHKISFLEPEEDENFLLHKWSTFFAGILFPFMEDFLPYYFFDDRIPAPEKSAIMDFYHQLIQRFLFTRRGNQHLLSKNPSFSPKIASLIKHFPTAKIVYLVRNPLEMLPSTISWLGYTWHVFSDPLEKYPFINEIVDFTQYWYRHPLEILKKTDPANYLIIKFDDLVKQPEKTIQKIYSYFGYTMTESFEKTLKKTIRKSHEMKNPHSYSLEEMGLSQDFIRATYADIFQQFDLK